MAPPRTCNSLSPPIFLFSLILSSSLSYASDSISLGEPLSGTQKLISAGEKFELGFFKPGNSSYYYVGIWYSLSMVSQLTPVWVANRDTPLADPFKAELKISTDGNLVISNNSNPLIWSTNYTAMASKTTTSALLLDSGNLVLRDVSNPNLTLWQSFDHPTHTWLPGAKLGLNNITKEIQHLTSWKSQDDPAPGIFSLQIDPNGSSQFLIFWNSSYSYWTSGLWNDYIFSWIPEMTTSAIYDFDYVSDAAGNYFVFSLKKDSPAIWRIIMDVSGQIKQQIWVEYTKEWNLYWSRPSAQCQVHALCGPFGSCNEINASQPCNCVKGFNENLPSDWALSDWAKGCVRNTPLQCGSKDMFFPMPDTKFPDNRQRLQVLTASDCESGCLNTCSCTAYSYDNNRGCLVWYNDLLNLQDHYNGSDGGTIFLRLAASELTNFKNKKGVLIGGIIGGVVGFLALLLIACFLVWQMRRKNSKVVDRGFLCVRKKQRRVTLGATACVDKKSNHGTKNDLDLPLFEFRTIAAATDYFSDVHKLGEGGFGPVYKGKLGEDHDVAVKRLARTSLQGVEEFKNEVLLIAKLQHRNLVRLLGCCIQGEERLLIYEYMPNKSLDIFLFDKEKGVLLDWKTRYEIIIGITRGLLYLHHDSRFRIIHRDLKASNILLDKAMNPKISDFGLARIFGGDEMTDLSTRKVVGTYGYMSPEYAMDGIFSMKSDVFSFGVLLLEIISGRKNRGAYTFSPHMNLVAHAWSLWNEGKSLQLVHESMGNSYPTEEALKCIKVGLLCVQEHAEDRPLMSSVVVMLGSATDIESLPVPKQPGFVALSSSTETDTSSRNKEPPVSNDLTISLYAR